MIYSRGGLIYKRREERDEIAIDARATDYCVAFDYFSLRILLFFFLFRVTNIAILFSTLKSNDEKRVYFCEKKKKRAEDRAVPTDGSPTRLTIVISIGVC